MVRLTLERGATLVELLVASTLFLLLTGAVLFTLRAGQGNLNPAQQQSESLRACLLSLEHMREELQSAWLLSPTEGEEAASLSYRVPSRDAEGRVLTGPTGDIVWSPIRTVSVEEGALLRVQADDRRVLARLGAEGGLRVERSSPTFLSVTVSSSHGKGHQVSRSFHLKNQF